MKPLLLFLALQSPPPGSPFPQDLRKLQTFAQASEDCHSWGWSHVDTLIFLAWALQVPSWNLSQGVLPIVNAIP
jgi:hypothetical protein